MCYLPIIIFHHRTVSTPLPRTLVMCRVQTQISGIVLDPSLPKVLILLFNQYFRLVLILQSNGSTVL